MQIGSLPLASLVLEIPQLQFANWKDYLETFCQDAGGFALLGLWIWLLISIMRAVAPKGRYGPRVAIPVFILVLAVASLACYAVGGGSAYLAYLSEKSKDNPVPLNPLDSSFGQGKWWNTVFTV